MKQNKNSVIVRIILWTLTALILLGVLLWGLELLPRLVDPWSLLWGLGLSL